MKDNIIFLRHIIDSIKAIEEFSKELSEQKLKVNRLKQNAIIRELEVIGEAVKNINEEFRNCHPEIEWKKIAGAGDKLIHHYFGVDIKTIWDVIKFDMPLLKEKINFIINKENKI